MMPLMKTFSRPEISGWNPAPSSISAEIRPSHAYGARLVGFVMPATSLSAVLLPDPLRPMTPSVCPFGTVNDTSSQRRKGLRRAQVAQDAALKQRALQRREVAAAVPAIDLGDVDELDRGRHTTSANESRKPIEEPVAESRKNGDRRRAQREQPPDVAERRRKRRHPPASRWKNRISWYDTARWKNGFRLKNAARTSCTRSSS